MKKIFFLIIIIFSLGLFLNIENSFAAGLNDAFNSNSNIDIVGTNGGYSSSVKNNITPEYYIGLVLNALFSLLGIIFIGLSIYSGIVWMTSRGNEAKVTKAKDTLTELMIGLIFIVGAYALTTFVLKIFTK